MHDSVLWVDGFPSFDRIEATADLEAALGWYPIIQSISEPGPSPPMLISNWTMAKSLCDMYGADMNLISLVIYLGFQGGSTIPTGSAADISLPRLQCEWYLKRTKFWLSIQSVVYGWTDAIISREKQIRRNRKPGPVVLTFKGFKLFQTLESWRLSVCLD